MDEPDTSDSRVKGKSKSGDASTEIIIAYLSLLGLHGPRESVFPQK